MQTIAQITNKIQSLDVQSAVKYVAMIFKTAAKAGGIDIDVQSTILATLETTHPTVAFPRIRALANLLE